MSVNELCAKCGHYYAHRCGCAPALAAPAGCVVDEDAAIGRVVKWQIATRMTMQNDRKRANPAQIHTDTTLNLLQQIISDARLAAAPKVSEQAKAVADAGHWRPLLARLGVRGTAPQADPAPAVACCYRLQTGNRSKWQWMDGLPCEGTLRLAAESGWKIEYAALTGQATPEGA